jgi:hypothetical protein
VIKSSAQSKIIILSDLPNSFVPNIGQIPSHHLFPILGKIDSRPGFYLHCDGSIYQLFKISEFNFTKVCKAVENLPENSSLQIYRLHNEEGQDKYFISLRIEIDYNLIDLNGSKFFSHLLASNKIYGDKIEQITKKRLNEGLSVISDNETVAKNYNEIYDFLCNYEIEGEYLHTKYSVKSNISAILTGKSKHSCVLSINNLDSIPIYCNGILKKKKYLEVVTIVRPSITQKEKIEKSIEINKEILTAIRPLNLDTRDFSVDTMRIDIDKIKTEKTQEILFVNVSFCLSEESLTKLREKFKEFDDELYEKGIVPYCHSNSARAQFISMFPGNSVYGEHWNKCYRKFGLMLMSRVLSL